MRTQKVDFGLREVGGTFGVHMRWGAADALEEAGVLRHGRVADQAAEAAAPYLAAGGAQRV